MTDYIDQVDQRARGRESAAAVRDREDEHFKATEKNLLGRAFKRMRRVDMDFVEEGGSIQQDTAESLQRGGTRRGGLDGGGGGGGGDDNDDDFEDHGDGGRSSARSRSRSVRQHRDRWADEGADGGQGVGGSRMGKMVDAVTIMGKMVDAVTIKNRTNATRAEAELTAAKAALAGVPAAQMQAQAAQMQAQASLVAAQSQADLAKGQAAFMHQLAQSQSALMAKIFERMGNP